MTSVTLRLAVSAAGTALVGVLLAGCGGDGSDVDCSTTACTVTFDRGVDAEASILGVTVKLAGVHDNQVTLEAGGQQLDVPIGSTDAQSDGLSFRVEEVTADKVVLKVTRS